jgi:hypothetical protein
MLSRVASPRLGDHDGTEGRVRNFDVKPLRLSQVSPQLLRDF